MGKSMQDRLKDRTALVTGGSDGIGKEIARALAQLGARLIIVGRDPDKGTRAEREIRASANNSNVEFIQADLSLVREARRLGDDVANRCSDLHYLVHSAGVVRGRRVLTREGFESNFATNYLSRFALTARLLAMLQAAGRPGKSARILLVAHPGFDGTIHYEDVNLATNFSTIRAFKQFHYANDAAAVKVLMAEEFEGESGVLFSMVGKFKRVAVPRNVQDPEEGKRLWALSEALVHSAVGQTTPMLPTRPSGEPVGALLRARSQ